VVSGAGLCAGVGRVKKPSTAAPRLSSDASPRDGCCRAAESRCRVAEENKAVRCFAKLKSAGAARYGPRKSRLVNLLILRELGSRSESRESQGCLAYGRDPHRPKSRRPPGSETKKERRKTCHLMSIHEDLPPQATKDLKEVGSAKGEGVRTGEGGSSGVALRVCNLVAQAHGKCRERGLSGS